MNYTQRTRTQLDFNITVSLFLQKSMSTYVSDCYDSIAIFLCIHIIFRFRAITTKRNIPALDKSVSLSLADHIYFYKVYFAGSRFYSLFRTQMAICVPYSDGF